MLITANVYRYGGDCTNGGVSSKHDRVIVWDPIANPSADLSRLSLPVLKVVRRNIGGQVYVHAEPVEKPKKGNIGWMAGGNFVYSCDSRFPHQYPLSIHDRQETTSENAVLSR